MKDGKEKELYQQVNEEKDRAQIYLDIAGVMLAVLNDKGEITLINKKGCEILGYSESELINKNWFDICIHKDIREEIWGVFNKLIAGDIEPVEYYENTIIGKNGEPRLIAFHNTVLRDEESRITGVLFSGEDVTERNKIEKNLKESEERFRIIFNNSTDGILIADMEEKKFFMANDTICRMLGYTREEITGLSINDIHPEADLPHVAEQFERQARGEFVVAENLPVMRKDRKIFYADIRSKPIMLSGKEYLAGVFTDITDRNKALQLIESISRFPSENPNPVTRIDSTHEILYTNDSFDTLLKEAGLSKEDSLKILPDNIKALVDEVLITKQPLQYLEVTVGDKVISYNIIPVAEQGYVNLYGRDITEIKKAEDELKARTNDLERINRAFIGRELKMVELKKEIGELKKRDKS